MTRASTHFPTSLLFHPQRIAAPYGVGATARKALNKKKMQMGLGLKINPAAPLVVCVTRLVPQKGIHLIKRAIYRTAERGGQAVLLGTGHADGELKAMAEHDFAGSDTVKLMLVSSSFAGRSPCRPCASGRPRRAVGRTR
jgi:glycosyltransferase involved in cell wall biosynthesis